LVELYEAKGFAVQSGLSPLHFPGNSWADLPFTYIFKDGEKVCDGGGIALPEITFLETLFEHFRPSSLFVIGNAFGWSTLALALLNPNARTVAIDLCPRPGEAAGLDLTNHIAAGLGLDVRAVKARSPEQVAEVATRHFAQPVDFVFIDGGHTNQQQTLDFEASHAIAAPDAVYLFHDVVNFALWDSFVDIARENPELKAQLLFRTPSGMGICYPPSRDAEVGPAVRLFSESQARIDAVCAQGKRLMAERHEKGPE
jgi:predicted O-methyltransferase YrrM